MQRWLEISRLCVRSSIIAVSTISDQKLAAKTYNARKGKSMVVQRDKFFALLTGGKLEAH